MKKLFAKLLICCCLPVLWASSALAQKDGVAAFSAADSHQFDTVDLPTLTPSFNFPVISKGAGVLPGNIFYESPQSCHQITSTTASCQYPGSANSVALYSVMEPMFNLQAIWTVAIVGSCTEYTTTAVAGVDTVSQFQIPSTILYDPSTCGQQTATVTTNDGSGLTVGLGLNSGGVKVTSAQNASGWTQSFSSPTFKVSDPFSNFISWNGNTFVFTDSLGAQATEQSGGAWQYTDANGSTQNITLTTGTALNFSPYCNNSGGGGTFTPITSINYPDSTKFSITWDKNGSNYSGLIGSVTLRTGGTITYTYNVGSCTEWYNTSLTRATSDGNWSYSLTTASNKTTTTVKDPGLNKVVYVFVGSGNLGTATATIPRFTSTVDRYQNTGTVASPSYTHISETAYCYNTHISDCSTYLPAYPITQLDTYQYVYNTSGTQVEVSHDVRTYDSTYGLLLTDANTDEITTGTPTITKTIVYGTYVVGTGCQAITNTKIVDHPCTVTTTTGGNTIAQSGNTYNSNGALTASYVWTGKPSVNLTTTYTPNTNGTYSAIQDPNGQTTNYTYGSCNSLLPTDITTTINSIAIDKKATWNCNAAVVIDTTDANSNEDDTAYDSMNRIHTHFDRLGDSNTTTYTYGTPTLDHVEVQDPMGVQRYTYNDGYGRTTVAQTRQSSTSSNYDTVSTAYSWKDSMSNALTNFQTTISEACSQTLGNSCSTVAVTSLANPVAGPVSSKDVNLGTTATSLDANDISVTAGPAPTNENTKTVVTEKNGFGQVTSVCAVETSNGSSSCGQLFSNSGILTSTAYTYGAGSSTATTTRGSQTHTAIADALGRPTSFKTPETGSTARTFVYDSYASTDACTSSGGRTSNGDLLRNNLPDGTNYICYIYDGLHRETDVKNSIDNSLHPCKRFRYDSTANGFVTTPSSYPSSGANIIGRLMEAETDDCNSTPTTYTDEWFAYDANGRMTDMWEKTPNSGSTYYHTTVAYDADGVVTTISGIPGYTSNFTFTTDGEDRPNASKFGTTTVVSATAGNGFQYDNASRPLNVPWGTGGNQDTYTYDGLEHMTEYTFTVGSTTDDGKLTWNSIGSLQKLVITDGFNSGGSQTCKYLYDDVSRLGVPPNSPTPPNSMGTKSVDCGTNYNGEYGWDQYNNLTQAGTNSWAPGYSSSNNQMTGSTYDTDGNVTYDGVNSYATNVYAKMVEFIAGNHAVTCGTNGTCITYDAGDRAVEMNNAGTYSQILYGPTGRLGIMNGQTASSVNIPQPGGGSFVCNGANCANNKVVMHRDWLGTVRLGTLLGNGNVSFDTAYAPFSQTYNTFGTINNNLYDYTGDLGDIAPGSLFDTPNRELFTNSGRWLQPEFSGSFNGYAYVTDPNTQTDPSGLCANNPYAELCGTWGQGGSGSSYSEFPGGCGIDFICDTGGSNDSVPWPSDLALSPGRAAIAASMLELPSYGASSSWDDNSGQCGGGSCANPLYGGAGGSDKGLRFLPAVIVPWPTMWDGYYDPYNYFQFDEMRDLYNTTWDGFTPEEIAAINDGTYGLKTAITEEELGPIIGAATVSVSAQWLAGDWVISKARDVINPKPVGASTLSDIPAMYNRVIDTMYDLTFGWFLPISHLPSDPNVKSTFVPEAVSCSSSPVCY